MARDTQNGQHKDQGKSTAGSVLDPEVPFPEAHKTTTTKGIQTHTLNLSTVEVGLGSKIRSLGSSSTC